MSEVATRLVIVAAIVLAVFLLSWARRLPRVGADRLATSLQPGVYLFSSNSCLECDPARVRLLEHLGLEGFVEIDWESDREHFDRTGIDAVPTTVLVREDGTATFVEGIPGAVLDSFSP
jgi:hypothetical protein